MFNSIDHSSLPNKYSKALVLTLERVPEPRRIFLKTQLVGPHPHSFALVDLGWGLRICISNRFPDYAAAATAAGLQDHTLIH